MGELPRAATGEAYGKQYRTKKPAEAGHVVEQADERLPVTARPYEAVNLQAGASLLIGGSEGIADF
jgi:hypothetical protein